MKKLVLTIIKLILLTSINTFNLLTTTLNNKSIIFPNKKWIYIVLIVLLSLINIYAIENLYTPRKERKYTRKKIHILFITIIEILISVYISIAINDIKYSIFINIFNILVILIHTFYILRKKKPTNKITLIDEELFRVVYLRKPYKIDGEIKINKGEIAQVINEEENTLIIRKFNGEDYRVNKEDVSENMEGIV